MLRQFEYVGPPALREESRQAAAGTPIESQERLLVWLRGAASEFLRESGWATFVVDLDGRLIVAPRRTEHVACASDAAVLAAGEIQFDRLGEVLEITNNSTGYCPAEDCWESVRAALDRAGLQRPSEFSILVRFRRCPACGERNLVKDEWYRCALCDAPLPAEWNFHERGP